MVVSLETCWHYRLSQEEVENVNEVTRQLVSACSEHSLSFSVWPCGLVNVDLFKGFRSATET
jgi:hypothetical protein